MKRGGLNCNVRGGLRAQMSSPRRALIYINKKNSYGRHENKFKRVISHRILSVL